MSTFKLAMLGAALLASTANAQEAPTAVGAAELGTELRDQTLRVSDLARLVVNTVYLDADGTLRIMEEPDGAQVTGRWFVREGRLCVEWEPRGRECWAYPGPMAHGSETIVTSDRGQRLRVTLI